MDIPINKIHANMLPNIRIDLTKVSQSIIANQIALNFNQEIKLTSYYKQGLKGALNKLQVELIKSEAAEYDPIFNEKSKEASDVYAGMEEMIKEISSLGIMHFTNIKEMVKAYKKDPKSMEGIVNKINR